MFCNIISCFLLLFRFVQGTHVEFPYAFYHWQYIDIFNYFTHNMVTIPPAVWTNAAHKHGVTVLGEPKPMIWKKFSHLNEASWACVFSEIWQVMLWLACSPGTFITEWTDGGVACEAFLKDEESYRAVADKLVQISHCYGFDGWLINIENSLSVSTQTFTSYMLRNSKHVLQFTLKKSISSFHQVLGICCRCW